MKQKLILSILGIVLVIIVLVLFIRHAYISPSQKNNKLNVIVSILPQKAFVRAVGGDLVNIKELIHPGDSPESYQLTPNDLALVENADIYFRIGYIPFERSNIDRLSELNPNMKVVDTSANIQLRSFTEHNVNKEKGIDPHIWLSPLLVKTQINTISRTLSQKDPKNAEIYQQNAQNFKKQLDKLHSEIAIEFKDLKTNKLMVFHPSWGYFADEFGLEEIGIEQSGKEPSAKQLQILIEKAKKDNIKVIFVSPEFNKNIAQSLAEEIKATVVSIDPLSENYINNLKNVSVNIAQKLNE